MSDRAQEASGEAAEATVPCPNCGAAVPLAEADAATREVTCLSCGTRVPVEKTPTRGVSPS
jgi:DNA-directed RNA polymerase subunit RPC12/RpoP